MMKSKETPAVQWHDYPQEEPTKDGYYRINGLFGIREEKKPMQTITWYSASKKRFAVQVGNTGNTVQQWAER